MDSLPEVRWNDWRKDGFQRAGVFGFGFLDDERVARLPSDLLWLPVVEDVVGTDSELPPGRLADVDRVREDRLDPVVAKGLVVVLEALLPEGL